MSCELRRLVRAAEGPAGPEPVGAHVQLPQDRRAERIAPPSLRPDFSVGKMENTVTNKLISAAALLVALGAGSSAYAGGTVTGTFDTLTSSNPDVEIPYSGNVITGLVKSQLDANGLPVETTPGTFQDVNGAGELQWWTPDGTNVTAGSSNYSNGTYSIPFDFSSNFFANGTSDGGANGYISAHLQAKFTAPHGGTVTFNLGSDDDAWIFLNGTLVVDNGGIHAFDNIAYPVTTGLVGGANTVDVFMADRHTIQSGLYFDANVQLNAVPEPSTWAMMGLGFAALGFAGYRARKGQVAAA